MPSSFYNRYSRRHSSLRQLIICALRFFPGYEVILGSMDQIGRGPIMSEANLSEGTDGFDIRAGGLRKAAVAIERGLL